MHVGQPGPLTTVQDLGRRGFRRFGVPLSGALDAGSLRVANLLVGNPEGTAALEFTLAGPELEFGFAAVLAVTGADLEPRVNGRPVPMWQAVAVQKGDRLRLGLARAGCRGYLAVAGGIDVAPVMGSRSTYLRAGLGGFQGRALARGDILPVGIAPAGLEKVTGRRILPAYLPRFGNLWTVRAVPGPQADCFTAAGLRTFFGAEYRVSPATDRTGCRLTGPAIAHAGGADIVSDGVLPGSVQVPGDGKPIVILADGNPTGGYAKIATVIHSDLWQFAHMRPDDLVRFQAVSVDEARRAGLGAANVFSRLLAGWSGSKAGDVFFFTAPCAGVFFRSCRPGGRSCIRAGEAVEAGHTIGMLEFMKLTLELRAGAAGLVLAVLADDGAPVKAGQGIVAFRRSGGY